MTQIAKNRMLFWMRFVSWTVIGCVVPVAVFAYKFGLFEEASVVYDELGNVISKNNISLNGWGIVSCLIVGGFVTNIFKELADACVGYSLLKQCYMGLCKTMPLIIAFTVLYFLNGVIEQIMFCLMVVIICKIASTPLNPLPKWKFEKQGKEDYSTMSESLTKFVKSYMKRGDA